MAASPTITSVLGLSAEEVRGCETQLEDLEHELQTMCRSFVGHTLHKAAVPAMEKLTTSTSDADLVAQAGLKTLKEKETERQAAEAAKEPAV